MTRFVLVLGIEPRALSVLSICCTTELCPLLRLIIIYLFFSLFGGEA
jgi:hypothetical protein